MKSTPLSPKEIYSEISQLNVARQETEKQLAEFDKKLQLKREPANLENDILKAAQGAIAESIKSVLTGYGSPLTKLITSVVDGRSAELREIISSSFDQVIRLPEFKQSIVDAFSHKVARTIISNNEGLFDKVCNELKQDAQFKSKITLAVAQVVNECLKT